MTRDRMTSQLMYLPAIIGRMVQTYRDGIPWLPGAVAAVDLGQIEHDLHATAGDAIVVARRERRFHASALPLRDGAGDADGGNGRHGPGRRAGYPVQEQRSAGDGAPPANHRAGQDGDAD